MNIAVKGLIGAGALGGVVTGGYYAFKPSNIKSTPTPPKKQSLKDVLSSTTDFEALSTKEGENATEWKKLVTEYLKTSSPAPANKITVADIQAGTNNDAANIKKLQEACETLLSKTENFEADKAIVTNWCNKNSSLVKN